MVKQKEGGLLFFEPSILEVELRTAWTSIICARYELWVERIFLENDSTIIISWIWDRLKQLDTYSILCDI